MTEPVIKLEAVSKWYGALQVLRACSLSVDRGEVVVVCGPSGSGKSTLIKCVNALEPFQQGGVTVAGVALGARGVNLPKLRARVGMVFQHFELFPHMRVVDNLCLGQTKVLGRPADQARSKAMALLDRVGMAAHAEKYPGQLSELARSGMTMMVVTHEMGFARKVAHRVVFMDQGEIVEDRPTAAFFGGTGSDRARAFLSKILTH